MGYQGTLILKMVLRLIFFYFYKKMVLKTQKYAEFSVFEDKFWIMMILLTFKDFNLGKSSKNNIACWPTVGGGIYFHGRLSNLKSENI